MIGVALLLGMTWLFMTGYATRGARLYERDSRIAELEGQLLERDRRIAELELIYAERNNVASPPRKRGSNVAFTPPAYAGGSPRTQGHADSKRT